MKQAETYQPQAQVDATDRQKMTEILQGAWLARAVHVAAELRIADLLAAGPRSIDDLAAASDSHGPTMARLMRALARRGVFESLDGGDRFANNGLSRVLLGDPGCSQAADARFQAESWHWAAWGELRHCVQTGGDSFEVANGVSFWELTRRDAHARAVFHNAMGTVTVESSAAVPGAYDFSGYQDMVDVAGGEGILLTEILTANPHLRARLLERPKVAERAARLLAERGLADRCDTVEGDFFVEVPAAADIYLIKQALHDWEDDDAVRILSTIRRAMRPDSVLLVLENVVDTEADADTLFQDLLLLVLVGGRERGVDEWRRLLERAGLRLTRDIPTEAAPMRILEAKPA